MSRVTGSPGLDVVLVLLMLLGGVAEIVALVFVGSWADRRLSSTPAQALEDLKRYGPWAAGLRVELLPPEVRAEVLKARRERDSGSSEDSSPLGESRDAAGAPH